MVIYREMNVLEPWLSVAGEIMRYSWGKSKSHGFDQESNQGPAFETKYHRVALLIA